MRGAPDHTLHHMFDDVASAAGFSRDDIGRWGGEVRKAGTVPWPHTKTFQALIRGDVDAIFDEAANCWVPQALDAGITILQLTEGRVVTLEAMGYRRAILPRSTYHKLPDDVLSLDFSGWTVFVHSEADDDLVTQICAGLDARKARIPWEEPGDLPVERMAREAPDTPQTVPLHPAAERFWRGRRYILAVCTSSGTLYRTVSFGEKRPIRERISARLIPGTPEVDAKSIARDRPTRPIGTGGERFVPEALAEGVVLGSNILHLHECSPL